MIYNDLLQKFSEKANKARAKLVKVGLEQG